MGTLGWLLQWPIRALVLLVVAALPLAGVSSPMKLDSSGVSPATGQSAFTRMPAGASSTAIALVAVITQPFDALYQFSFGRGLRPAVEATLMIDPVPRDFMCGTKCRAAR